MDEAVTFLNFAYGSNMLTARLRERQAKLSQCVDT